MVAVFDDVFGVGICCAWTTLEKLKDVKDLKATRLNQIDALQYCIMMYQDSHHVGLESWKESMDPVSKRPGFSVVSPTSGCFSSPRLAPSEVSACDGPCQE